MKIAFETSRLKIEPVTEQDAAFILELFNSPNWLQFIGDRKVKTEEDSKKYIKEQMVPQFQRLGYGNYTLTLKEGNQKIGTCGLFDREGLDGIDLGFAILPAYERRGYGFEAAIRLIKAAFHQFGIEVLNAITTDDNIASQSLLEKLGFNLVGTTTLAKSDKAFLLYQIAK